METLSALLAAIPQPDVAGMARAQQHIDGLLKPPGSLGRLETLAVQLAGLPGLQGQLALAEKAIVVMCADHGVWHEGVTPSPQVVTAIHAGNMVRGNTGVCVLAAQAGARVQVVDVGIDADPLPGLINLKVARGSGNIARTAAMSRQQAETVLLASMHLTRQLAADGVKAFGVGELGMANTTPAAATISVLTGSDPDAVVGCGANLPLAQRGHKVAVVRQAIAHNQPNPADGLDVLAKVGGYDLVGMTGVILGRPPVACRWCWMASSPMPLPWPPAAWPRRRTLILFLHTCRRRKERRSPSTRWVCGRISIWTCAWERAAAPRWRCTCWMPPA
ncbi:nicotinate-nucleotide-dimethylbenzimidazole phosphoribosyltransferase [Klebsiella pneumoniae]|nr:nicotinate-nucleotide-dimethylbenzimidazole phosphoribosyltransferase [Klebsiella pneumoniae]